MLPTILLLLLLCSVRSWQKGQFIIVLSYVSGTQLQPGVDPRPRLTLCLSGGGYRLVYSCLLNSFVTCHSLINSQLHFITISMEYATVTPHMSSSFPGYAPMENTRSLASITRLSIKRVFYRWLLLLLCPILSCLQLHSTLTNMEFISNHVNFEF